MVAHQEIQRLIGRSLRAGVDRVLLGERQITSTVMCCKQMAGTRCASITGGWVALRLAAQTLVDKGEIAENPITEHIAAVSCGIYQGQPVLDLDYPEDSEAGTDANFVMTGSGGMVELQGSAEGMPFSEAEFMEMLGLARKGVRRTD